jgi:hypothetical protein
MIGPFKETKYYVRRELIVLNINHNNFRLQSVNLYVLTVCIDTTAFYFTRHQIIHSYIHSVNVKPEVRHITLCNVVIFEKERTGCAIFTVVAFVLYSYVYVYTYNSFGNYRNF